MTVAADFLEHLYAYTDTGWLTLFSVDRTTGEKPTRWAEIGDIDTAETQAAELAATGCVWFGVAPRIQRLSGGRRGGAADCLTIPALWLDVDIQSEAHATDQLPATVDEAQQLLNEFPLPPTAIVDSGHGLQAWWQLTEPVEAEAAQQLLTDWGATWAQLGNRHGWHVDNVFDLARVMRLPGTWNRKTDPRPVRIISEDWERTYGIDDIDSHLIAAPDITPPVMSKRSVPYIGPERPGDAYNAVTDPGAILERAGFHYDHSTPDGERHYRAPHRTKTTDTTGATVYPDGHTTIWSETFARSSGMEVRRPYDAYGLFTHIEHRGDWQAATRALRAAGYGADDPGQLTPFVPIIANPDDPWPAPIPLGSADAELPTFPLHTLPDWMAAQAQSVAAELQMPADLPAILGLTCLAAFAAKKTKVHVRTTWYEPLNLYVAIAMPPSAGKSPAFSAMLKPLKSYESDQIEKKSSEIAKAEQKYRMAERKMKKAEEGGKEDEAEKALTELLALDKPVSPRMIVDDATPEALTVLLAEHAGRIAMLSTEGGVFDIMTGRYSDKANLDVYLKAWGGDDITVDRIGRGPSKVLDPALTIGLTVQPSVIAALAEKPELAGRGLTARFMYAMPVDTVGRRNFIHQDQADPAIAIGYAAEMLAIAERLNSVTDKNFNLLRLDPDALETFNTWRQQLEVRRLPNGDLRPLAEWSTKLESSVIRVAGLLHLAGGNRLASVIDKPTITRAIEIGDYWLAHAHAVHDLWGSDPVLTKARAILAWATGKDSFTLRDLYASLRRTFPKADDTIPPVSLLIERGWLRPTVEWPPALGRNTKSPTIEVNPACGEPQTAVMPSARSVDSARTNSASDDRSSVDSVDSVPRHKSEPLSLSPSEDGNTPPSAHCAHCQHWHLEDAPCIHSPYDELDPTGTEPFIL